MPDGLFSNMGVKTFFKFLQREAMISGEEILQIVNGFFCLSGGGINLYPIASGDDHVFLDRGKGMNLGQGPLPSYLLERPSIRESQ